MELVINEASTKTILKEIMLELILERQDLFHDIIREVIEETGLAEAIREGRQDNFVTEEKITSMSAG